jgi:adenine-specific DNA-methyltransferase
MKEEIEKGNIVFGLDETTIPSVRMNLFENTDQVMRSVTFSYAQKAAQDFAAIFGGKKIFDNPKSYLDLERLINYLSNPGDVVLDFFAGTATTAHGVLRSNAGLVETRRFICVQLPEAITDDTETGRNALSLGFQTIADIGRERIRRVIDKLKAEPDSATTTPSNIGFKAFQLTPSNFKQWRGEWIDGPEALASQVELFIKSEKDGAAVENILYEILLKFGQPLTTPVERLEVAGTPICAINGRAMLFVLDRFTLDMIEPLLALKPREIVALDSVFHGSDELKSNLDLQCRDADVRFICT